MTLGMEYLYPLEIDSEGHYTKKMEIKDWLKGANRSFER
jgi:hypothetical protein